MTKVKSEQITGLVVKYPGVRNKKEVSADIQQQNHKNLKHKRRKCCSCCLSEINDEPSSFWTGIMTNLGICTLLLAYILLGSFIFLTLENDNKTLTHNHTKTKVSSSTSTSYSAAVASSSAASSSSSPSSSGSAAAASSSASTHSYNLTNPIESSSSSYDELPSSSSSTTTHRKSFEQLDITDVRRKTIENIWDITVSLNILYRENWTKLALIEIEKFQDNLVKKLSESPSEINDGSSTRTIVIHEEDCYKDYELDFSKAFLYSLTVLTTIGYGNMTPRTTMGRMVTLGYAIFGIPLTLIYLSSTGSVLAKIAKEIFSRALCCCLCSKCGYCCYDEKRMAEKERRMKRKRQIEENKLKQAAALQGEPYFVQTGIYNSKVNFNIPEMPDTDSLSGAESKSSIHGLSILAPITLCFCMMVLYILFGAFVLNHLEKWPLLDGIYFCFMSLSTIGCGNLVPGANTSSSYTTWFCSLYIMSGMALTAMCFNVLHTEIINRIKIVIELNETNVHPSPGNRKTATEPP